MNRQSLFLIGIIAVALLFFAARIPPRVPVEVAPALPALPPVAALIDSYTASGYRATALDIAPESSTVRFAIPFMGSAVSGMIGIRGGTITLLESEAGSHVLTELFIDMPSITTGSRVLDGILRAILEVETHRTAVFIGVALNALPGLYSTGEEVHLEMPAELHIANEMVSKVVNTEATRRGGAMRISAVFRVQLAEAGISSPPLVGDYIDFEVRVNAR